MFAIFAEKVFFGKYSFPKELLRLSLFQLLRELKTATYQRVEDLWNSCEKEIKFTILTQLSAFDAEFIAIQQDNESGG